MCLDILDDLTQFMVIVLIALLHAVLLIRGSLLREETLSQALFLFSCCMFKSLGLEPFTLDSREVSDAVIFTK